MRNPDVERTQAMFVLSHRMKDMLDQQAATEGETLSGLIRRICAEYIGYDLEAELKEFGDKRKDNPRRKYKTDAERREAINAGQRRRYQEGRQLLEDFRRQMHANDVAALEKSLKNRGVDTDA